MYTDLSQPFMDFKKISAKTREQQTEGINALIDGVVEGDLSIDATTKEITQVLKFPLDGEIPVKELKYKPRVNIGTIQAHLQGVKATDADGRILAYIAALTGSVKAVIKNLDTEDHAIGQSIALFFI